ncbi:hypothetical protein ABMY28_22050 [Vibrio vulnificus]|uniref:hypothetical protein n=1 Tax=Vibrio vulnificus TaxID=672 RepID=UPI00405A0B31
MSDLADKVNNFAIRSFRDTADMDYVNARMAFRAELFPQFRWGALHSLEKYAKCLLILQRVPKSLYGNIRHEVLKSLDFLYQEGEFEISKTAIGFISDLEKFGARHRYFEVSWRCKGIEELKLLDLAVHEIRRLCSPELYSYSPTNELNAIDSSKLGKRHDPIIQGGYLEKIVSSEASFCRNGLVWENAYYSDNEQKEIVFLERKYGSNSPLYLYPEIVDEVRKYCIVPKEIIKQCKVG